MRRRTALHSLLALTLCGSAWPLQSLANEVERAAAGAVSNVVEIQSGKVSGSSVDEGGAVIRTFKGVPYAAPPVGPLRWKAPQPAAKWSGVRDATQFADRCAQSAESSMGSAGKISEDCLHLNVVTAAKSTKDALPVMVFFHGGGLTSGTGNSVLYTNTALPRKGVVLVTVNSRLGPLGYLAHPALSSESERKVSGNYGTLDLIASLQWVQSNIAAFGGDPKNVLIFGESGGGTKTISLLTSPLAKGLFHKAIVESGSGSISPERTTTLATAEASGQRMVEKLGLKDQKDVLGALRSSKWEDLVAAAVDPKVDFRANLAVDGYVLPVSVNDTLKSGKQHDVPLIVGANAGEERELKDSVPMLAGLMSKTAKSKTYVYNFSHVPSGWKTLGCSAFHGLELPYVFGYVPEGLTVPTVLFLGNRAGCKSLQPGADAKDELVAEHATTMWAQFAATGDPSVKGLVTWPAYTGEGGSYLDIAEKLEVKKGIQQAYIPPPQTPAVGAEPPASNPR